MADCHKKKAGPGSFDARDPGDYYRRLQQLEDDIYAAETRFLQRGGLWPFSDGNVGRKADSGMRLFSGSSVSGKEFRRLLRHNGGPRGAQKKADTRGRRKEKLKLSAALRDPLERLLGD